MAKLPKGILGPIIGIIGNIVGVERLGVTYIKARPKPSLLPPTEKQVAQRARFKFMQQFLLPFKPYFMLGFPNPRNGRTSPNVAFSLNYRHALKGEYPDFNIDFAALTMSKGSLPRVFGIEWEFTGTDQLELTWYNHTQGRELPNDQVMFVLYDRQLGKVDGILGGVKRSAGTCKFTINPQMVGHSLEMYFSLYSIDRKRVSDSVYLGRLLR